MGSFQDLVDLLGWGIRLSNYPASWTCLVQWHQIPAHNSQPHGRKPLLNSENVPDLLCPRSKRKERGRMKKDLYMICAIESFLPKILNPLINPLIKRCDNFKMLSKGSPYGILPWYHNVIVYIYRKSNENVCQQESRMTFSWLILECVCFKNWKIWLCTLL